MFMWCVISSIIFLYSLSHLSLLTLLQCNVLDYFLLKSLNYFMYLGPEMYPSCRSFVLIKFIQVRTKGVIISLKRPLTRRRESRGQDQTSWRRGSTPHTTTEYGLPTVREVLTTTIYVGRVTLGLVKDPNRIRVTKRLHLVYFPWRKSC